MVIFHGIVPFHIYLQIKFILNNGKRKTSN
jgi:hypothetical protein